MPKLARNNYTDAKGVRKLNCYSIAIPKKVVEETGINADDEVIVYANGDKIIIEFKDKEVLVK